MTDVQKIRYRIEKVPPESGWGYIVILGLAIPFGFGWAHISCFGLIFNDFIKSVGGETSAVTVTMGFLSIAMSVGAIVANTITKMFSMRTTALIGAIICFVGNFISIFANSIPYLIISYGLFTGIGMGLMVPSSFGTFNEYFVKRRILMLSVTKSLIGILQMLYPIIVRFLMKTYGFRCALAILAALSFHAIPGMLLMHPVKWHYKIIQVPDEESQPFIKSNGDKNVVNLTIISKTETISEEKVETSCIEKKIDSKIMDENLNGNGTDNDKHTKHSTVENEDTFDRSRTRLSIASVTGGDLLPFSGEIGKWQNVINFLDLDLFKDPIYVNIIVGLTLAFFGDSFFFILEPMYLFDLKISKDDTAIILALTACFDLAARIFLSIVSVFITLKARSIFTYATIAEILLRFVFLNVFDFTGLAIVSRAMGFIKTFVHLPLPLVIAEHLPKERFAAGYGQQLFLQGFAAFLLSPIIGWIRDYWGSYAICFHALSVCMGFCTIPWLLEFAWFWFFPRKSKTSVENLNENQKT